MKIDKVIGKFNEEWTVWIDSDGVIADFEALIADYVGTPFHEISKGAMWRAVERYDSEVAPFFESLPKMKDADTLIDFVKAHFVNYGILTASGHVPKNGPQQKRNWYKKHYGNIIVKVVTKSPDKAEFAKSDKCILIDDRKKSIDPWVAAGGTGILHTSAADTINQLKQIVGIQ